MNPGAAVDGQNSTRPKTASRPTRDQIDAFNTYVARLRDSGASYSAQDLLAFIHHLKLSEQESSSTGNHHLGSAANLSTVEVSSSSTRQVLSPLAEEDTERPSPGNAALPSTNQGPPLPFIQATVDTISSANVKITPYEKLYPGFDPKEDLEVNLASQITICRWGNCSGVRCGLDKMWCAHIFGDCKVPKGVSHMAEIFAPQNRLPGGKVRCLWQGCEQTFPMDGLKEHIEDAHLLLYRLRCIYCGTEKRDDTYHRTHGPASLCPQNPRLQQVNTLVPPSNRNPCTLPPFTDGTPHALDNTTPPQSSPDNESSSSSPAPNPASAYQDSLGQYLDKRLESLWSSRYPRSPTTHADAATQPIWRTPAAILSFHPQQYGLPNRHPAAQVAAVSTSFAPQFIAPELLVWRQAPTDPRAPPPARRWGDEPRAGSLSGQPRDMPARRRRREAPTSWAPHSFVPQTTQDMNLCPTAAPAPTPLFRSSDDEVPGAASPVGMDVL